MSVVGTVPVASSMTIDRTKWCSSFSGMRLSARFRVRHTSTAGCQSNANSVSWAVASGSLSDTRPDPITSNMSVGLVPPAATAVLTGVTSMACRVFMATDGKTADHRGICFGLNSLDSARSATS